MIPSVSVLTGFDCEENETYDTIFELGKIWGREGDHKEGKGSSAMLPLIRKGFVNMGINFTF